MLYQKVALAALGAEIPPKILTSAAIEDRLAPLYMRIGLLPGRLELMTGILERRYWPGIMSPSEAAIRAGERALARSPIPRDRIGCLIHASVCRDFLEPATANVVHDRLGLSSSAQVFDVSNACLGVASAMLIVSNMIELGQIEAGLVVAGEIGQPLVDATIVRLLEDATVSRRDIKRSFASLTIGSGAAAVLLADHALLAKGQGHRLLGAIVRNATRHHGLCRGGSADGARDAGVSSSGVELEMSTDAEALLTAGISLAKTTLAAFLEEIGWSRLTPQRVITHQVGRAHDRMLFESLGLDPSSGFVTYDRLGNVGSVSLPITLALAAETGFVTPGQDVALLGIGSGLSSVMMAVRW